MTILGSLIFKVSLVLAVAAALNVVLNRASAGWRHLLWGLTVAAVLVLPVLSLMLPAWDVPIRMAASPELSSGPVVNVAGIDEQSNRPSRPVSALATAPHSSLVADSVAMTAWWIAALPALYATGIVVLLFRLIVEQWSVIRLARAAVEVVDPAWTSLLVEAMRSIGVRRPVRLLRGLESNMPMAFGWIRPAILIPSTADTWSESRRRAVLLHELAHIARNDCFTQRTAGLACGLYWAHPGVWWAARRLRIERELACDDRVLAAGMSAREYAEHLLDLAFTLGGSRAPALAVTMARPRQIEGRILAVLDDARSRTVPPLRRRVLSVVTAMALVTPLAAAEVTRVRAEAPVRSPHVLDSGIDSFDRLVPERVTSIPSSQTITAATAPPTPAVTQQPDRRRVSVTGAVDIPAAATLAMSLLPLVTSQHPDLSGHWILMEEPKNPAEGTIGPNRFIIRTPRPSLGMEFDVKQDSSILTITQWIGPSRSTSSVAVYKLDGSDSSNMEGGRETLSIAVWQDSDLLITTRSKGRAPGMSGEIKRLLSLESVGAMKISTTLDSPDILDSPYINVYHKG